MTPSPGLHARTTCSHYSSFDGKKVLMRTYSFSSGINWGEYHISVERKPLGQASRFLHDSINVSDTIQVSEPAANFTLDQDSNKSSCQLVGVCQYPCLIHTPFLCAIREQMNNDLGSWGSRPQASFISRRDFGIGETSWRVFHYTSGLLTTESGR